MPNTGFAKYGEGSRYGQSLYGDGFYIPPPPSGLYPPQAFSGACPTYQRFALSGLNLPLYIFELNPDSYDSYPQRTTQSYKTILDFDPTIDETYKKIELSMGWTEMSDAMWSSLLTYSRKLVDGTSEPLYAWDSTVNHLNGTLIKIEQLKGQVQGGNAPVKRFSVSLKLRII